MIMAIPIDALGAYATSEATPTCLWATVLEKNLICHKQSCVTCNKPLHSSLFAAVCSAGRFKESVSLLPPVALAATHAAPVGWDLKKSTHVMQAVMSQTV